MKDISFLYPLFALVGWTIVMSIVMLRRAFRAVGDGLDPRYFRYGTGYEPPDYMRAAYQHYTNLFEMPVLFYTAVITAFVTGQTTVLLYGIAWAYVAARMLHSVIHLKNTNVPRRRDSFLISVALLFVMWCILFVNIAMK